MWKILLAATAFSAMIGAHPAVGQSSGVGYRLGAGDVIRVKVFDWRKALGEVHEWSALKDKYRIGPDGNVSLPLIGTTQAAGHTVEAVAATIADRLQTTLDLKTRPQASVEVLEFRPFYILGGVNHPGGYPYRPGLTVLQAVSVAGGLYRVADLGFLDFQRQALTTVGDLQVLRLQYDRLLARRARLKAQLDGSDSIAFPTELSRLQDDPSVGRLLQEERVIFKSQRDALRSQMNAQNHLKQLLDGEIASLGSKLQTMDQELALLKREKTRIGLLVTQGLAAMPRAFELRQTEFQAESRRLDIGAAVLRAREDVERADQAIAELQDKNRNGILGELAQAEAKLDETAERIKAGTAIANRDAVAEPELNANVGERGGSPIYSILRRDGERVQTITATAATDVEAGDTVDVKLTTSPAMAATGIRYEGATVARPIGDPPQSSNQMGAEGSGSADTSRAAVARGRPFGSVATSGSKR